MGWIIMPSFMYLMRSFWPSLATIGSVAGNFGTEMPGVIAAILVIIAIILAWYWLPESHVHRGVTHTPSGRFIPAGRSVSRALWEIVRHPAQPAHRVIWIYVVGMLALNVVIGVLGLYLYKTYGITEKTIGYIFMIFGIVGVVMRAPPPFGVGVVGWANHKFGEVRTMQIGTAALALGLALMPLPSAVLPHAFALPVFLVLLALVPVGTALLFPASTSLVSQRTERHEIGLVMGAQQTFRGMMSIVGPSGATVAFHTLGHGVPFVLAALVVAVAGMLAMREPRDRAVQATIST